MQTKLTLRLDHEVIDRAKAWAARRGVSLSKAVASLFEQLPREPESLSPWTRKLVGIGGRGRAPQASDEGVRRAKLDHLARKHR